MDVDVRAPTVEVRWGDAWEDVTDTVVSLEARHGSQSFGNPDRPLVASLWGSLQAFGAVGDDHRGRRFPVRVSVGDTVLLSCWISDPDVRPGPRPITRWLLRGLLDEHLERRRSVTRRGITAAELFADTGLWARLVGGAVSAVGVPERRLGTVLADQHTGGIISRLAAVTSTEPVERSDGSLRFAGTLLAAAPDGIATLDASSTLIDRVETVDRSDRIRNTVSTAVPDIPGQVTEHRAAVTVQALADGSAAPSSLTEVVRVAESGTVSDVRVSAVGPVQMWVWEGARWIEAAAYRDRGAQESAPYSAPDPTVAVDGGDVTVAQPAPSAAARWQTARTRGEPPFTGWATFGPFAGRYPTTAAQRQAIYGWGRDLSITWTQTAPDTVTPPTTVANPSSISRWGVRELELPDWLASGTDLRADIDALAGLRRQHNLSMPIRQASGVPLALDAGDYVRLRVRDMPRNVAIDHICLIAERGVTWQPRYGTRLWLRCLETGAAAPAAASRLLAEDGSAILAEDGSAILVAA